MALHAGTRLGSYQITSLMGAGGMGEVYSARDSRLGRDVAIKIIREGLDSEERLARVGREARLLASLNHPGIAILYGMEEWEGAHFLVMELVEGETLLERIRRGPIPVAESLSLFWQITQALEAAHRRKSSTGISNPRTSRSLPRANRKSSTSDWRPRSSPTYGAGLSPNPPPSLARPQAKRVFWGPSPT